MASSIQRVEPTGCFPPINLNLGSAISNSVAHSASSLLHEFCIASMTRSIDLNSVNYVLVEHPVWNRYWKGQSCSPHPLIRPCREAPRFGQYNIVDYYASPWLQRWDQFSQDLDAILIGPVVQDPTKQVYICPYRLFSENIVGEEPDAAG